MRASRKNSLHSMYMSIDMNTAQHAIAVLTDGRFLLA
jgi:hypothetical protein